MGLTVPGMGKQAIVNVIYPVGSIYMSTVNITPAAVFGGEWEAIRGRFLLAESDNHAAGSTGGEENHKLTVEELADHGHTGMEHQAGKFMTFSGSAGEYSNVSRVNVQGAEKGTGTATWQWVSMRWTDTVENSGGSQPHNNMPPYLAVYVWKRIA